jgi:hypothetical protein
MKLLACNHENVDVSHFSFLNGSMLEDGPGSCLDHLSPSMSLSFLSSDDITLDIISLSLFTLVRLLLACSFVLTVFIQASDSSLERDERGDRTDK